MLTPAAQCAVLAKKKKKNKHRNVTVNGVHLFEKQIEFCIDAIIPITLLITRRITQEASQSRQSAGQWASRSGCTV